MIDTQQKVKLADLQIEQLSRMKKHANLTHVEITSLPNNTRVYEGVGRMYVSPLLCRCCHILSAVTTEGQGQGVEIHGFSLYSYCLTGLSCSQKMRLIIS